jgi:UDP-N-acetylmuramoylalanine--D-glutamate ligase
MTTLTRKTEPQKIAFLGFGREGLSALRFIRRTNSYRDAELWVLDRNRRIKPRRAPRSLRFRLGPSYLKNLGRFDLVIRSPGIPYTHPEVQRAIRAGTRVTSPTKLFFESVPRTKLIGVTGSKGKGTTCTLLSKMLSRAGKRVVLAGNIGAPMFDVMKRARNADYVVLELSSFQLEDLTVSPHIAVVLDIFPEHLDVHQNQSAYLRAKSNICAYQTKSDRVFYFATNTFSKRTARLGSGRKIAVAPRENSVRKNFDMATAVARSLGVSEETIARAVKQFRGLPHRLEPVGKIGRVRFVNDSAATNPHATAAAIASFKKPIVLIAGGSDKGLDFAPLSRAIRRAENVALIVLYGANRKKIRTALKKDAVNRKINIIECSGMKSATKRAYTFTRSRASHGSPITILLSPASASFDQFKDYADRGKQFRMFVRAMRRSSAVETRDLKTL